MCVCDFFVTLPQSSTWLSPEFAESLLGKGVELHAQRPCASHLVQPPDFGPCVVDFESAPESLLASPTSCVIGGSTIDDGLKLVDLIR